MNNMRELKFRAWGEYRKALFKVERLEWHSPLRDMTKPGSTSTCSVYGPLPDGGSVKLANCDTLMQYTGLRDKNGVEIYEGDIVRKRQLQTGKVTGVTVIEYNERTARFNGIAFFPREMEVIGNIYENPDLLK